MTMFVILLKYIVEIDIVNRYLEDHRAFLDRCYAKEIFLASGPKVPRDGGVILAISSSKEEINQILQEDPFWIQKVAQYEVIQFQAVKHHPCLANLMNDVK